MSQVLRGDENVGGANIRGHVAGDDRCRGVAARLGGKVDGHPEIKAVGVTFEIRKHGDRKLGWEG